MKNKMTKILLSAVAVFGIFMELGWGFFSLIVRCTKREKAEKKKRWKNLKHAQVNHPRYKFEEQYEAGKAWCAEQPMQDRYIKSHDGLRLHAKYLPAKDAKRTVLLAHGYKGSGFGDFANMAKFLHENQCNLLFIDQRCCGESEGNYISFGAMEKWDVQRWVYDLYYHDKKNLPIYLYGESMGAASVLMASEYSLPKRVKGIIADCGFCSMKNQLEEMAAEWFHLHWIKLLLFRVNLFCGFFGGFRMRDADTTRAMLKNTRPVLFFHGELDTYVNAENSRYNYALCKAPKELIIVPQARHLCSNYEQPELYRSKVLSFFHRYDG